MYHTSLAFDNETNELYWRVYTYANLYDQLRKINIYDGTSSQVGIFSDDRLMGDFHIPFTVAPPGAPAKVGGLSVVVDADGMPGCIALVIAASGCIYHQLRIRKSHRLMLSQALAH